MYILTNIWIYIFLSFPGSSDGKESACNAGDPGSTPRSRRCPGEGNSNPLQYSCMENSMDREFWRATVNGVRHNLVTNTFTFHKYIHVCLGVWLSQLCPILETHGLGAHQTPLSMGLSLKEYWSGLPFPSPGALPNKG